jgi:dihydrofolate reductase
MSELTVTTFMSLDGVMQAPGGPNEDPSNGFEHGGWLVPHVDDVFGAFMNGVFDRAGAFLLGRTTYEIFANHWPRVTDPTDPIASRLNALPKYVASTTLKETPWHNSTLLGADVVRELRALKERPGKELQVHGSCGLLQTLLANDLVDEHRVLVFPVMLGSGKRAFGRGTPPRALKLLDGKVTSKGVVIQTYRRAGALTTGSFELET